MRLKVPSLQASSFEGYSGVLVFMTFMPIGIMLGGLIGAVGLGYLAADSNSPRRAGPSGMSSAPYPGENF